MTMIAISGYGKVGRHVLEAALNEPEIGIRAIVEKKGHPLVGSLEKGITVFDDIDSVGEVNVIVEFSTPEAVSEHISWAKKNKVAMLVATTGLNSEQRKELKETAKEIPILLASNVTLGMNTLFFYLPKIAKPLVGAGWVYDIEELHRKGKKDAPSGTALTAGQRIEEATGQGPESFYSVRAGTLVGTHKFRLIGPSGEMIEITHTVPSREDFARAAISLAKLLDKMTPGRLYGVEDLIRKDLD